MLRRTFAIAVAVGCLAIGGSGAKGAEGTDQSEDSTRVEVAEAGIALSFPASWTTEIRDLDPAADPDSSPALLIAYDLMGQSCSVGRYPESWNIDLDRIEAEQIGSTGGPRRERLAVVREAVAGLDAIRTDWRHDEDGGPGFSSGFDLDTPDGIFWLTCYGNQLPEDSWHSIADTFELSGAPANLEVPTYRVTAHVIDPGLAPRRELRYRWTTGQTDSMVVDMWEAAAMRMEDLIVPSERAIPLRVYLSITVVEIDANGTALIETVVEGAELISPKAIDDDERRLHEDIQTLVGLRLVERLDDQGYLLGSLVIDPVEDTSGLHRVRDLVKGNIRHLAPRLPTAPIGEGGVWQEVVTDTGEAPAGIATYTKTLIGTEGSNVHRILTEAAFVAPMQPTTSPEWLPDAETSMAMSGEGSGRTRIDIARLAQATSTTDGVRVDFTAVQDGATSSFAMQTRSAQVGMPDDLSHEDWLSLPPIEEIEVAVSSPGDGPASPAPADEPPSRGDAGVTEVTVLDPGVEPRRQLRYAWTEGLVEDVAMELRQGTRALVDGVWTPWVAAPAIRFAVTSTVSAAVGAGTWEVALLYTDISVPKGSAQLSANQLEEMESQLSSFVGTRQMLLIDDRGRVLSAETSSPADALGGLLTAGQFDAMSKDFVSPLPIDPVGAGAQWEVSTVTPGGLGFVAQGTTTVTLGEIIDDSRIRLLSDTRMDAEPQPMTLEALPDLMDAHLDAWTSEASATQDVDLTRVNPHARSSGMTDSAYTVSMGDEAQSTRLQTNVEMEIWQLDLPLD